MPRQPVSMCSEVSTCSEVSIFPGDVRGVSWEGGRTLGERAVRKESQIQGMNKCLHFAGRCDRIKSGINGIRSG